MYYVLSTYLNLRALILEDAANKKRIVSYLVLRLAFLVMKQILYKRLSTQG